MSSPQQFLSARTFAVAGASRNPEKYGYKVFQALLKSGRAVVPMNPTASDVEGHAAYASIKDMPTVPDALSIITPPAATRTIVEEAVAAGVKHIWMQPGAQDEQASSLARQAGLNVIDDGSCILVVLSYEKRLP